ncbi:MULTISPECIES: hypothetical protein [Eikenella]|uniref:Uncharacterized protein n=1 Tax=Eikenella longinqua TaxID=1795827 RepID=A0A1A9S2I6_9NEIS|nr:MULTISPECIES: hypothetical protein [Eikenella]OAM31164.1 hypothetical protein A7P95_01300 [Eikenella longinqua]
MSGKEMPPSSRKPQRSMFSRVVLISFVVAFVVVMALVMMAWLMLSRPDSRTDSQDASAAQGVEIWQPNGASAAAGQTYSLPPAADMNAASQASAPLANARPAAPRRAAAASAPAVVKEVPIQPVAPQPETEIRPIEVPVKPAPQPVPRQPAGEGGGNPVDSLF